MSDVDYAAAGGASGRAAGVPGKHRGPRFTWNAQYEATFFRSLCESVQLGLRDGSTFKPEAWERAIQALIEKHNAYANKGHLINKTDNARKKYRLWRGLREDPEFYYNAQNRTVTATDDAWARHLQKEPLARSLRGRPFEHEEYYEILFPDVIGSGGAPKRLTKPRRKTTDTLVGTEEPEAPGTAIMDLLGDAAYINPSQTHMPPPMPPAPMPSPMAAHPPQPQPQPQPQQQQQQQHARPTAPMQPPPQRASVPSASALTPPEETALQTRKRLQAPDNTSGSSTGPPPDKRRRTAAPGYLDLAQQQQQHSIATSSSNPHQHSTSTGAASSANPATPSSLADVLHLLAEALRGGGGGSSSSSTSKGASGAGGSSLFRAAHPGWQEQAMDTFFRDFAGEDMDLQLKIAEKMLTDEAKAMVFCKMPDALRRHWVKRLREVHNRIA